MVMIDIGEMCLGRESCGQTEVYVNVLAVFLPFDSGYLGTVLLEIYDFYCFALATNTPHWNTPRQMSKKSLENKHPLQTGNSHR